MILSISFQAKIFLMSILVGGFIGFIYDILRVSRRLFKHKDFVVQLEDLIYWITMSVVVFLITLYQNNGEIREFLIFGIFLGMIFYFFSISILFLKVSTTILKFLKKIFLFLFNCILMPFKILYNIFKKPVNFVFNKLKKLLKNLKSVLQKTKLYNNIYKRIYNFKNYAKEAYKNKNLRGKTHEIRKKEKRK